MTGGGRCTAGNFGTFIAIRGASGVPLTLANLDKKEGAENDSAVRERDLQLGGLSASVK